MRLVMPIAYGEDIDRNCLQFLYALADLAVGEVVLVPPLLAAIDRAKTLPQHLRAAAHIVVAKPFEMEI